MRAPPIALAVTLLCTLAARANDGPPPDGFGVFVDEPDVIISINLADGGEPNQADITREGGGDTVEIGQLSWSLEDASETWVTCREEHANCETEPELCVDCDGDEIPECSGWCITWGTFWLTDECVPVEGEVQTYTYRAESYGSETVDVEHVDDCQGNLPSAADDDDDDDERPGMCQAGGTSPAAPLTALMLLVGGLGWVVSRRRG